MPYRPDNSLCARCRLRQQRWSVYGATSLRFFVVIGFLLVTAHRSPAPVVEGSLPFKRTFFTLKGHAVDTFVNEKKLPQELDPAFGGVAPVLATQPLIELTALMKKFGHVTRYPAEVLSTEIGDSETPEMKRRAVAMQKIAKSQLKKIAMAPTLWAATREPTMSFSAFKFPSAFFADNAWSIESYRPEELLKGAVWRPERGRLEIPTSAANFRLFRYATKGDIEILRRVSGETDRKDDLMRFYADVCRGGAPQRLLPLTVYYEECGSGATYVRVEPPPLQIRIVVLENITDRAIDLGQFYFRSLDPGPGILTVRTRAENEALLASVNAESAVWYKPRMLKPGEKIIVPLELLFKPNNSRTDGSETEAATTRARRGAFASKLLADRALQTIAILYEGKEAGSQSLMPLVVMPKQKFVDGLLREPVPALDNEEFVYGPSIVLDSVDVNGFRSKIEPFDPINIAYFSGYLGGSCPFVYSRHTADGAWLKQGTIMTGRSSKAREGTSVLEIHAFDGTLRIVEEEDEVSYIDELFVRVTLANGKGITLRPTDDLIAHKDFRYLVLKKGEAVEIEFSLPDGLRDDPIEVVASGFFELSALPVAQ